MTKNWHANSHSATIVITNWRVHIYSRRCECHPALYMFRLKEILFHSWLLSTPSLFRHVCLFLYYTLWVITLHRGFLEVYLSTWSRALHPWERINDIAQLPFSLLFKKPGFIYDIPEGYEHWDAILLLMCIIPRSLQFSCRSWPHSLLIIVSQAYIFYRLLRRSYLFWDVLLFY